MGWLGGNLVLARVQQVGCPPQQLLPNHHPPRSTSPKPAAHLRRRVNRFLARQEQQPTQTPNPQLLPSRPLPPPCHRELAHLRRRVDLFLARQEQQDVSLRLSQVDLHDRDECCVHVV